VPDVPRPPVSEVVHSIALARQSALSGPLLPSVLGDWFTRHPRVEPAPPYEIPPEPANLVASVQPPRIQLMATSPLPRYWLISDDDQELVQVQPDYLALNWRNRRDDNDYPGYTEMRNRFHSLLRATEDGLSKHQGALKPIRAELTYINTIHPDSRWSSHHDTGRIIRVALPAEVTYERLSFSYSNPLVGPSGEFSGRLHVTLNPAVDWIKQEPQLSLNLTARSADFSQQNIGAVLQFMDLAHSAIEDAFNTLITKDARRAWGLQ
jgi:uncharacterized protein (TIGR04255 family)